jgi:hypothetical protein
MRSGDEIVAEQENGVPLVFKHRDGNWQPRLAEPDFRFPPRSGSGSTNRPALGQTVATSAAAGAIGGVAASAMRKAGNAERPNATPLLLALVAIGLGLIIIDAPGILAVALLQASFNANWDVGQMWSFSLVLSLLIATALWILTRNFRKTLVWYAVASAAATLIIVVGAYGFKSPLFQNIGPRFTGSLAPSSATKEVPLAETTREQAIATSPSANGEQRLTRPQPSYHVSNIRFGDSLNIRQGPGSNYPLVRRLPPGTVGITVTGNRMMNGNTIWQQVTVNGVTGWVNAEFLAPEN